jgi:TRAP-type C4-dicarboxylate transport system permease small subunit
VEGFAKTVNRIAEISIILGGITLVGAMLLMVSNIIYRFFGGVIPGTVELVGPFVSVTASFALSYTTLKKSHVVMDMIFRRFSKSTQLVIHCITSILSLGFFMLLAWKSAELLRAKFLLDESTTWLKWPMFPFRSFWVLGLIILCLVILADLLMTLTRRESK